jgi:hypothetical protein
MQNFVQYPFLSANCICRYYCGFQWNRPTNDQIFCSRQKLGENWEYNGTVRHLIIDLEKAYNSVRTELVYDIPMKLFSFFLNLLFYLAVSRGFHL